MRKVKFKMWNNDEEKQYVGSPILSVIPSEGSFELHQEKTCPDITLRQFTGICDYEENEIYEYDILYSGGMLYGIVEFNQGGFIIKESSGMDDKRYTIKMWMNTYPSKVVGNIFENPEILPSKKSS